MTWTGPLTSCKLNMDGWVDGCMYVCMYICTIYACMCVCTYVRCMHVCVYVHMHDICMSMPICVFVSLSLDRLKSAGHVIFVSGTTLICCFVGSVALPVEALRTSSLGCIVIAIMAMLVSLTLVRTCVDAEFHSSIT